MKGHDVMDDQRFDNLIRALHHKVGSRRALTAFLAGLSLSLIPALDAAAGRGKGKRKNKQKHTRKRARKAKSIDPGVRLFESLAAKMKEATGDCDALAQAAEDFKQAHLAEFNELATREQQWDAETRARVAKKHQARITQATESLHTLMASCRFRGTSDAPICEASGGDPVALPGEAQCGAGCDCSCICPISGWDCTFNFFGCLGGSEASCCWFGACAGNICAEQCPNCCNCGPTCCGC
jgi:hypothetical protein